MLESFSNYSAALRFVLQLCGCSDVIFIGDYGSFLDLGFQTTIGEGKYKYSFRLGLQVIVVELLITIVSGV